MQDVSCSGDMEEIRSMCGICPQHNILYDELTAKEHLLIFAGIKGVPADKTEAEVSVLQICSQLVFMQNIVVRTGSS